MKALNKIILGLLITASGTTFCNEEPSTEVKNSFPYWGVGVGIPTLASVKFGNRMQTNHHGFDYGIGLTPLIIVTEGHIFGSYIFYPKPNLDSQMYVGVGLRMGGFFNSRHKFGYIAPGVMIGKEFVTYSGRRFLQVAFGPVSLTTEGCKSMSSVSVAFGYGF